MLLLHFAPGTAAWLFSKTALARRAEAFSGIGKIWSLRCLNVGSIFELLEECSYFCISELYNKVFKIKQKRETLLDGLTLAKFTSLKVWTAFFASSPIICSKITLYCVLLSKLHQIPMSAVQWLLFSGMLPPAVYSLFYCRTSTFFPNHRRSTYPVQEVTAPEK